MTDTSSVSRRDTRPARVAWQIATGIVTLAITLLGLLVITFIIARVVPIDPVLALSLIHI